MIFLKQSINISTSLTHSPTAYISNVKPRQANIVRLARDIDFSLSQVGFTISPVTPENSGQYWCLARYRGKSSEYGISLNVLMETR